MLFLGFFARVHTAYTWANADPGWMVMAVDSLVTDRDLNIKNQLEHDPIRASDQVAIGSSGEWYPIHEPFIVFLAAPFFALFGMNGCLLFNLLISVAHIMICFCLISEFASKPAACVTSLLLASTSLFLTYSYSFSIDVLGVLWMTASLLALVRKYYCASGFFWGLAFLSRIIYAPVWIVLCIHIIFSDDKTRNKMSCFLLSSLTFVLLYLFENQFLFGSPLALSFNRQGVIQGGELVIAAQSVFQYKNPFSTMMQMIFNQRSSFLAGMPLLIFGIAFGISPLLKLSSSNTRMLLSVVCLMILFISFYGGAPGTHGNRYLMICYDIGGIFFAAFFDRVIFPRSS